MLDCSFPLTPCRYVQFAPLAYIVKLYIELTMAVLISKVVRSGSTCNDGLQASSSYKTGTDLNHGTSRVVISGGCTSQNPAHTFHRPGKDVEARGGSSGSQTPLATSPDEQGIMKTVETMVLVEGPEDARDR
jgi:hypothetical protein